MALKVKINGRNYDYFSNVNLSLAFDSLASTFSFDAYFDSENEDHRALFMPLSYHSIQIFEDKKLLLTGVILSQKFSATRTTSLVPVSGYSKCGVLNDVSIPSDLYPLETNQKTLIEIAEKLIEPFGIELVVDDEVRDDALKVYQKSNTEGNDSIGGYLAELACQRNIILSHDEFGRLRFTRPSKTKSSKATYTESMPAVSFGIEVNGQGMHSDLTVQGQATVGSDAERNAFKQNNLMGQYRPLVKEQTKGDAGDTGKATDNALAAELKNIALNIELDRWYFEDGTLITANNYVTVVSKQCFLTDASVWFIQSVTLTESTTERKASLTCVMPETFNGETPKKIFR